MEVQQKNFNQPVTELGVLVKQLIYFMHTLILLQTRQEVNGIIKLRKVENAKARLRDIAMFSSDSK